MTHAGVGTCSAWVGRGEGRRTPATWGLPERIRGATEPQLGQRASASRNAIDRSAWKAPHRAQR